MKLKNICCIGAGYVGGHTEKPYVAFQAVHAIEVLTEWNKLQNRMEENLSENEENGNFNGRKILDIKLLNEKRFVCYSFGESS